MCETVGQPVFGEFLDQCDPVLGRPQRHDVVDLTERFGRGTHYIGPAVADVGHDRSAARVENAVAVVANQPHVLGAVDDQRGRVGRYEWKTSSALGVHRVYTSSMLG